MSVLRSRLVHFAVAGGVIFALAPRPPSQRDIALDSATLAALETAQAQRAGASRLEAGGSTDVRTRVIEDEILYREALRLGFDRNDTVVRQRLIQKMLFLAEDLAGVSAPPTDATLRAFYEATRGQWTSPARVRLIHVYAAPAHRESLVALRPAVIAAETAAPGVPPPLGDAFALPRAVVLGNDELARDYGAPFAAAVADLPMGEWSEPVPSKFGWHLVKVLERRESGPATFEDVRGSLPIFYLVARKKQAVADFLRQAAPRYRITIDGAPLAELPSSGRVAPERAQEID